MTYDTQTQRLLDLLADSGAPPVTELSPEEARQAPGILMELVGAGPGRDVASVRDVEIPGSAGSISARIYDPVADPTGTVVYYHGGVRHDDQIHAFFVFVGALESADRAIADAGAAIRDAIAAKEPAPQ